MAPSRTAASNLGALTASVIACRACPRLVAWREQVARERRRAHADETYWGRAVPGFGDPNARLLVLGLAPAAHGANRTGRMFTGDRSGDVLFAALHRAGFANRPVSVASGDGLELSGAYVTAALRCAPPANKPLPDERDRCAHFLGSELDLLSSLRVVLTLGAIALDALVRIPGIDAVAGPGVATSGRPRFAHGAEYELRDGRSVLCSYHPSQRNVFTGLLTPAMLDAVFARARALGA